ncbi:flavodoxin-dependent (E)-4-hydroxy-3-methylbut-2-enyl-diphosphate synthase [Spirochaetia bacterium 38H-sp]|uniref:4-hydroxy-3-methylbut-2-en-1-yl diphosphate synthase (flavodoxin) n=1 Tax=Rarispira pelagica TaxID=3141764 RepID=A0ABU9UCK1_9SPIR
MNGYKTKKIRVGRLFIGGDAPLAVQTMWKLPLSATVLDDCITELMTLEKMGCSLVRFSVPDMESAEFLGRLAERVSMPLVADIHFDWRIAVRVMDFPVSKVRINPGNIGSRDKVANVVKKALDKGIAIRVGVNTGSLPRNIRDMDRAEALVTAAEEELSILESLNFKDVIFSLKASDIETTVKANRIFASRHQYPLHLGLTEAGPLIPGTVKSTAALLPLLRDGIGDTIRVSLSDDCRKEVLVGMEIARASGRLNMGVNIVSCPRCSRYSFDVMSFLKKAQDYLQTVNKPLTVAIMGCVVNGPGEAAHADIAISGVGKTIYIYKQGKKVQEVAEDEAFEAFINHIESLI